MQCEHPAPLLFGHALLLKSGKMEFLKHGFEKASLRTICANAGVTTGAFYVHFKGKDEFFRAIVEDDLQRCSDDLSNLIDWIVEHAVLGEEDERLAMEYVADHRDLFRLLFDCSEGSSYEGFQEELIGKLERAYQHLLDSFGIKSADLALAHTFVVVKTAQYREMIYRGYSKDEAMRIASWISSFARAGLEALPKAES